MSRPPLVSVVTIYRDAERFLDEAIGSVLAQSFDDWELLLVDDGSTDGGPALAAGHAARLPDRVRTLTHPGGVHRGMSATRNLGVEAARGELVAFLDADDAWRPGKLAAAVGALELGPEAVAAAAPAEYWYSWSGLAEDAGRDFVQRWPIGLDRLAAPPELLDMYLADEWHTLCDVVVRRDAFLAVGGYETAFPGMYEDQAFHAKLILSGPIWVASESAYRYRQHPDSCTSRSSAAGLSDGARERFRDWLERYLDAKGLALPATRTLIRRPIGAA